MFFIYVHKTNYKFLQFLQKPGKNNTNKVNISSLPNNIAKLKIHFAKLDNSPKFPLGPIISPSPGPTFEIAVAAPEKEVIKSNPVKDNNIATRKKIKN